VITNKKFWDGLPPDMRKELETAMKEATNYANDIAKTENQTALDAVKKSGKTQIITLTADEKKAWKKALLGVHREQESRIGKETLDAVYKATGFDPGKL
jgi:C4-dicarboxylate-binding protein DctP